MPEPALQVVPKNKETGPPSYSETSWYRRPATIFIGLGMLAALGGGFLVKKGEHINHHNQPRVDALKDNENDILSGLKPIERAVFWDMANGITIAKLQSAKSLGTDVPRIFGAVDDFNTAENKIDSLSRKGDDLETPGSLAVTFGLMAIAAGGVGTVMEIKRNRAAEVQPAPEG